jgi:GTP-binding protein
VRIKSVTFAGAVAKPGGPRPGTLPQIAFSGRSNVGKSSLINRILGRTRSTVARVSATPGKTQEINFYHTKAELADGSGIEFYLVDLPGYGYAKAPESVRSRWKPLIESYLGEAPELVGVVQLLDMRRDPSDQDRQMLDYLATLEVPSLVVLTKSDKLTKTAAREAIRNIVERIGLSEEQVVPFSSLSGDGTEELLESVGELLAEARDTLEAAAALERSAEAGRTIEQPGGAPIVIEGGGPIDAAADGAEDGAAW